MSNIPSLSVIPKSKRTSDICLDHLLNDPENICEIPVNVRKKIISQDIALAILKYRFSLISHLPRQILKNDFMQKVWTNRGEISSFDVILFLKFSPRKLLNRGFCHECIRIYPQKEVLYFTPQKIITRSFLEIVLKEKPALIREISPEKLNRKLVLIALKSYGIGLKYTADKFIDKQTSRLGILANPKAAKYAKFRPIQNY